MQYWITIEEKYLDYLRDKESRIPISDYGKNKFKPFFGVLFEKDGLAFVTQISHAKPRHLNMKGSPDFHKIFLPDKDPQKPDRLVAVVNLNYMFPVPQKFFQRLDYKKISNYRMFDSKEDEGKYIDLLKKELQVINSLNLDIKAKKIYDLKKNVPDNKISSRCFDFLMLEKYALEYKV